MAQELASRSPARQVQAVTFPKINRFFDGGVLIARRFADLLSEIEPAVLRLFLLLHLIIDLGVILLAVIIFAVALLWTFH